MLRNWLLKPGVAADSDAATSTAATSTAAAIAAPSASTAAATGTGLVVLLLVLLHIFLEFVPVNSLAANCEHFAAGRPLSDQEAEQIFAVFDDDKSGTLDRNEMLELVKIVEIFTQDDFYAAEVVRAFDKDGNDQVRAVREGCA